MIAYTNFYGSAFFGGGFFGAGVETQQGGGGRIPRYHPFIHGPRKYEQEFDVTPEVAEAVVEVVAKVVEQRKAPSEKVDQRRAEKALRRELAVMGEQWAKEYAQIIKLELARLGGELAAVQAAEAEQLAIARREAQAALEAHAARQEQIQQAALEVLRLEQEYEDEQIAFLLFNL